jgi:hypothetical protein
MECQKQGRPSCANHDMKREEYHETMRLMEARDNFEMQSKYPSMLKIQFHITARADDITNLETDDLRYSARLRSRQKCLGAKTLRRSARVLIIFLSVLLAHTAAFCSLLLVTQRAASL